MADIVYTFEGSVYLNITNSCPCKCKFCIRNNSDSVGDADTLWFSGHNPSFDEIKKAIDEYDFTGYNGEVIFCFLLSRSERPFVLRRANTFTKSSA